MPSFYIGYIDIPPAIEAKIKSRHGVTPEEVRELYTRARQMGRRSAAGTSFIRRIQDIWREDAQDSATAS